MNDNERGPGNFGRSAMGASILVALLLLDFPQGNQGQPLPVAMAQEAAGIPSDIDEDDDLPRRDISKSRPIDEDADMTGEAMQQVAPQPVILTPAPVEQEPQTVGAPAVSHPDEEDDEGSRPQAGDAPCDPPAKDAAPDPSPLSEDDDEASAPAIDDAASSGLEEMPDEFD